MNWISCKQKLPPDSITVLFFVPISFDEPFCMGFCAGGSWFDVTFGVTRVDQTDVTHWMPLPDPPPKHELI